MKKYIILFFAIVAIIIIVNVSFSISVYNNAVGLKKQQMSASAETMASKIENELASFRNSVNSILFSRIIDNLDIKSEDKTQEGLKMLEILFTRYNNLVKNISIYDLDGNILSLSSSRNGLLIIDPYTTQKNEFLSEKEIFTGSGSSREYILPVFKDHQLYGNIYFELSLNNYLMEEISGEFTGDNSLVWFIGQGGGLLFNRPDKGDSITGMETILRGIGEDASDFIVHEVYLDSTGVKMLSFFYPVTIFSDTYAIVFSIPRNSIFTALPGKIMASSLLSILVLILSALILLVLSRKDKKSENDIKTEFSYYNRIFDTLPIGIIGFDSRRKTRFINQAAKDILMIDKNEEVMGKSLDGRFMLSKDYYENSAPSAYDSEQYVVYRHQGEEVSVYKKDVPVMINDEEYIFSAFIDISHIEKARKYEAAANTAKSEFLARMSHEIRTPMNGIIGMTEALAREELPESQQDKISIIRKSADILLLLIDDILDFSKIESGKMQIEEIPFKLRDEVRISLELFRPVIESKNLKLRLKINPEVPDNIISDPFRLRQILSNLISNAIKFTHEGEIEVGVDLTEMYDHNLTLRFYVRDTGVGIPKNKIDKIFNAFTQADDSTSRKYGGSGLGTTISKQLVTLMNGEIWVESPCGEPVNPEYPGSKFCFTIEAYSNEKPVKSFSYDEVLSAKDINVIIIVKPGQNIHRLTRLLEHEKINCFTFEYEDDKYDQLNQMLYQNDKTRHIVIITDTPNFDGFRIARMMKEEGVTDRHAFIMLSSAHTSQKYAEAKRTCIDHYVPEPFDNSELINAIQDFFPNILRSRRENEQEIKTGLSVLIAEDNEINIKVADTIFSRLGLKVDFARNGKEAVSMVKDKSYDLVFMDLLMPEFDGFQATVELRASGYNMPIIAMTATSNSKTRNRAILSGMNDYIVKPIRMDDIPNVISKWAV